MIRKYLAYITIFSSLAVISSSCAGLQPKGYYSKDDPKHIWITGTGDSTLGWHMERVFQEIEEEDGFDDAVSYPYEKIKHVHLGSDITLTNLESVFSEVGEDMSRPKKFNFKCPPRFAESLNKGYIDIVNLANNHIFDYYANGAYDTIIALRDHGIPYCGGGLDRKDASFKIIKRKGIRVAFLGYGQVFSYSYYDEAIKEEGFPVVMNGYVDENMISDIGKALEKADIIVVTMHAGIEKSHYPSEHQVNAARLAIDSGADIVFMHHPHVLQGIEKYREGIIFYSLGNYAFGGNMLSKDPDAYIAQVKCSQYGMVDYRVIPIKTQSEEMNFQPFVPDDTSEIEEKIIKRSKPFNTKDIKFFRP